MRSNRPIWRQTAAICLLPVLALSGFWLRTCRCCDAARPTPAPARHGCCAAREAPAPAESDALVAACRAGADCCCRTRPQRPVLATSQDGPEASQAQAQVTADAATPAPAPPALALAREPGPLTRARAGPEPPLYRLLCVLRL